MRVKTGRRLLAVASLGLVGVVAVAVTQLPATASGNPTVQAELETPPLFDDEAGNNSNADDPAIWVHPDDSEDSLVIGTVKEGGLRVYDLEGQIVQSIAAPAPPRVDDEGGRFNNVDLLYNVSIKGKKTDIAVVSDRGRDTLRVYRVTENGLTDISDPSAPWVFASDLDQVNDQETAYGLATWRDKANGKIYALASQRHKTAIALLELIVTPAGTVTYQHVRSISLPSTFALPNGTTWTPCSEPDELPQVEGMVVDAASGVLYAGQEAIGIWKVPASLIGTPVLMDKTKGFGVPGTYDEATEECTDGPDPGFGGTRLDADVEGLTIYYRGDGKGYLLASSQGDNTFAVYKRQGNNEYLGSFAVTAGDDANDPDGSESCDGAMVMNVPLGDEFDEGLFVVQDGSDLPEAFDAEGEAREKTNFEFVEWEDIADDMDLEVDTDGWDPRD